MVFDKVQKRHSLYMDIAKRCAKESYAERAKVGCVITKNENIISTGWNGQPAGFHNTCEALENGVLTTLPTVLHAELNAIAKLAKSTQDSTNGTIYVTLSPCVECAKLIIQSGIKTVVFSTRYRDLSGVNALLNANITVLEEIQNTFLEFKEW